MNIYRYFTEDAIKLEMDTIIEPLGEDESYEKWQLQGKELVLNELITLLETTTRIGNRSKLLLDYVNREKKATTAIGLGIAIPHVRSMQAKDFSIAFARSSVGYDFNSLDKQPSHLFFIMAAPPYDDGFYLKVFKSLAETLQYEEIRNELMSVASPGEVIRVLRSFA